jgi:diacylglycerol O-acyltransferase
MTLDTLGPIDTGFLDLEDDVNQMHIGALLVLKGPPPPFSTLKEMVAGKLGSVPRYRQIVRRVAFDAARPVWADDPGFDIDYHLRHIAVPAPGDEAELNRVVADVMERRLDRERPLWELWMVEGVEANRWAVIAKVHHCLADGVGGVELLSLILDATPDATPLREAPWRPDPLPTPLDLLLRSLGRAASGPGRLAGTAKEAVSQLDDLVRSLPSLLRVVTPAAFCSLNGPIGPRRRWSTTAVPISEIKTVRSALGGSFNDVTLAAITRGFRGLLEKRGESLDRPLRTCVPVSVRARDANGLAVGDGTLANKVAAVFADLPVAVSDPLERLRSISEQMSKIKESNQARGAYGAVGLSKYVPPRLAAAAMPFVAKVPQRNINTIATNIPGPQIPLYAAGRPMLAAYPYVPIGMQVRIAVAVLSYNGQVHFGITGDYEHARDIEVVAEGIKVGMDEMLAAAGAPTHSYPS